MAPHSGFHPPDPTPLRILGAGKRGMSPETGWFVFDRGWRGEGTRHSAVEDDMPANLKKLVRTRMAKTGESYATALRYVRQKAESRTPLAPLPVPTRRYRYRRTLRHDHAIDAYVRSVEGELGALVARLVALVRSNVPDHDELRIHGAPQFCIDGEPFCYVV